MEQVNKRLKTEISRELGFSFNSNLARNLYWWRNAVMNQDIDCVVLVDGAEGSGKSVLGMQIAKFFDKDRCIDLDTQVCFFPEQVKKAIMTLPPGKAIVWDEARRGLNRRRSTQQVNLEMTDLFAECRQHNLFLVVIMPSFYDMDMNVAIWRSRALVHVWYTWDRKNADRPLLRGFFRFYNEDGKKALYTNKYYRQGYLYPYISGDSFDNTFVNYYVVDESEYRIKKRDSEKSYRSEKKKGLCKNCGGSEIRYRESDSTTGCRRCGYRWGGGAGTFTFKTSRGENNEAL